MLVDPLGHLVTSQKREIRITDARLAKFAAFADDAFRQLDLAVICPQCKQPPVCNNAITDTTWKMECACCVRVLRNPGVH